jgi:cell division transport system permease protein
LLLSLYLAQREIPEIKLLTDWTAFSLVFLGVIVLGVLISAVSTYFAVSKYLKLRSNELYR